MKAVLLEGSSPASLRFCKFPDPQPKPDELILQVEACGVCRTDLHILDGELPPHKRPVILGHQVVGRVIERGEKAGGWNLGQRAGVPWLFSACGRCSFCLSGRENLCGQARFTGYDVDGGYAQRLAVPAIFAHPIAEKLESAQAAPLLCAGAIGYRAFRKAGVSRGDRLGLYGFGSSAHLVLQAALKELVEVYVFTRSEEHRRLARELGAVWAGTPSQKPSQPLQAAVLFAPSGDLVLQGLAALDKDGRLVLAGIFMTPIPQMDYALLYGEKRLESVAHVTRRDVRDFLALASETSLRTEVQSYPLERASQALEDLRLGKVRGSAVLEISG